MPGLGSPSLRELTGLGLISRVMGPSLAKPNLGEEMERCRRFILNKRRPWILETTYRIALLKSLKMTGETIRMRMMMNIKVFVVQYNSVDY